MADGMIVSMLKAVHIAALILWCAGLIALPLVLSKHERGESQADYGRLRRITHDSYIKIMTPAAVVAVSAGTGLIYLRGVFVPWMFAKLVAVGLLVILHVLVGHTVLMMSERQGEHQPPGPLPIVAAMIATMTAVLLLVLGKPTIPDIAPDWLTQPLHRQLPVDETPI